MLGIGLGVLLLAQPLVVFVSSYHPRDCDDKAVHLFSALYATSSPAARTRFREMLEPFVRAHEADPRWARTAFRLGHTGTYPLADAVIAILHRPGGHFTESVKWGLLAVTTVAVAAVALIAGSTRLGFWQTALVLDLIGFHAIRGTPLLPLLSRTAHPFIWHAPRAAAALLTIALVAAVAERSPRRWLVALLVMFAIHTGLALVCAALAGGAAALAWLADRSGLLRTPYPYALFALGALDGTPALVLSGLLAVLVYLSTRAGRDFDRRASRFAALMLFLATLAAAAAGRWGPFGVVTDVPARLAGMQYCLLVLCAVLAGRMIVDRARLRWSPWVEASLVAAVVAVLGLVHAAEYERLATGASAFFQPTCVEAHVVPLPAELGRLSLDDEATMFVSFAAALR